MSHDTQSTGPGPAGGGQTPPWAPPGEGWVGSGHGAQQAPRDPYRAAPAQQHLPYSPPGAAQHGWAGQQGTAQHGTVKEVEAMLLGR